MTSLRHSSDEISNVTKNRSCIIIAVPDPMKYPKLGPDIEKNAFTLSQTLNKTHAIHSTIMLNASFKRGRESLAQAKHDQSSELIIVYFMGLVQTNHSGIQLAFLDQWVPLQDVLEDWSEYVKNVCVIIDGLQLPDHQILWHENLESILPSVEEINFRSLDSFPKPVNYKRISSEDETKGKYLSGSRSRILVGASCKSSSDILCKRLIRALQGDVMVGELYQNWLGIMKVSRSEYSEFTERQFYTYCDVMRMVAFVQEEIPNQPLFFGNFAGHQGGAIFFRFSDKWLLDHAKQHPLLHIKRAPIPWMHIVLIALAANIFFVLLFLVLF
jgi:hypothetical protein